MTVHEFIKKSGLYRYAIAERLGISMRQLQRYLYGDCKIPDEIAERLSEISKRVLSKEKIIEDLESIRLKKKSGNGN